MKDYLKNTRSKIMLALGVTLFGVLAVNGVLSAKDRIEVAKMTEKMTTVCVGRFLIDVPENTQVSLRRARISGFNIFTRPNESDREFTARVAAREAEINAQSNELGQANMEFTRELKQDGLVARIFAFGRNSTYVFHGRKKVTHTGFALEGYVHAGGISFDFIADDYDPAKIGNLPKLIEKLVPLTENEIPTAPGFCIDRALVRDPLTPDQIEQVGMFAGLPGYPDLAMVFHTIAGIVPGPHLLEREAAVVAKESPQDNARFTTLREQHRTINDIPGVELLQKALEYNFTTGHDFQWESISKQDNVLLPVLGLELRTGISPRPGAKPVQSSLADAALLALWDKISSSVRLRPTKPPKIVEAPPEIPPLGTFASAYSACPQSGWWQCGDNGPNIEICGGQVQYFRQGECVPQAIILTQPTLWQRIKREEPYFRTEVATSWKLVDYRKVPRHPPALPLEEASDGADFVDRIDDGHGLKTPVGQKMDTGTACPESGWWRCTQPGAVDDTRWFGQGKGLPQATFSSRRTWADKLFDTFSVQRRHSTWQLVRHDDGTIRRPANYSGELAQDGIGSATENAADTNASSSEQA